MSREWLPQKCLVCGAILIDNRWCPDVKCDRANPDHKRIAELEALLREAADTLLEGHWIARQRGEVIDLASRANEALDKTE